MRFAYAIAYVRDVERSVIFYEQAFGVKRRFVDEGGQYAEMETGETTLAFASNELGTSNLPGGFRRNDPAEPPAGVEIAFVAGGRGCSLPYGTGCRGDEGGRAEAEALGPDRRLREGPGRRARRDREPDVAG